MENIFQCCNVENLKKCNLSNFPFIQSSNKIQTIDEKAEVYISNDNYNHMKNINLNRSDIMNLGDYSKSFSEYPKNLELIVENSVSIQKGEIIIITPNGLLDSRNKRKRLNNEVLFGYFSNLSEFDEIDYELPPNPLLQNSENNNYNDDKNEGIFFCIFYKLEFQKYYIRDYEKGYGTFIKLNDAYKLKNNSLINIGDSYLVFNIENNNKNKSINENILCLKAYSGSATYEPIIFQHLLNKEFTIGRNEKDDVVLQDKMLSRVHCILFYDEEKGWFIKDGNEIGQPSTNGTWVFAYDEFEIYDGMIFKSNSNLFSCHLRNNKQ